MKKIVFVIEQLYTGGAERVTAELANCICEKFYEVHIITYHENKVKEYFLNGKIVRHNLGIDENNKILRLTKRVLALRRLIKKIEPTCVVSLSMPITNVWLTLALTFLKIPLILSERNDPHQYPVKKIERFLRQIIYRKCNGIVFQTEDAKKYFSHSIREKATIISNPINSLLPDKFIGNRNSTIVNFCRIAKQKNLDLLVEAFEDIENYFPEYFLHIYGDGPEKEHLLDKINASKVKGKIMLHEYSTNIHEVIKSASLFVSTSNYEGISNSMIEAIALGIPTICTDCPAGGARMMIEHGVNGFLVPVNDRKELVKAMKCLLSNKELADKFSTEGYKIREKLSCSKIAEQWLEYIEIIIK